MTPFVIVLSRLRAVAVPSSGSVHGFRIMQGLVAVWRWDKWLRRRRIDNLFDE